MARTPPGAGRVEGRRGAETLRHRVLSNLVYRYYDEGVAGTADFADKENGFPGTVTAIGFTQSITELGRRVDEAMKQRGREKR